MTLIKVQGSTSFLLLDLRPVKHPVCTLCPSSFAFSFLLLFLTEKVSGISWGNAILNTSLLSSLNDWHHFSHTSANFPVSEWTCWLWGGGGGGGRGEVENNKAACMEGKRGEFFFFLQWHKDSFLQILATFLLANWNNDILQLDKHFCAGYQHGAPLQNSSHFF